MRNLPGQKSIMKKQKGYLSGGYEVNVRDLQKCHEPHTILNP
jgi:hypothetical protein